jgi:predicted DNA binding CopG/RHH family protein
MKQNKDIVMKIRVPKKLYKKIKIRADKNFMTMTEFIRIVIVMGMADDMIFHKDMGGI